MKEASLADKIYNSFLSGNSAAYLESLYEAYLEDPHAVSSEWRDCFTKLPQVNGTLKEFSHEAIQAYFIERAKQPAAFIASMSSAAVTDTSKQAAVLKLIEAYRAHGHLEAKLDPLCLDKRQEEPRLRLDYHGLSESDLDTAFSTEHFDSLGEKASLREIYKTLQATYCQHIGAEYKYINNENEVAWIQHYFESPKGKLHLDKAKKQRILHRLCMADGLEKYLGRRFVGQKRFSLEGGDSLIPALDEVIQNAGLRGVKECVIGMAHRGRLNVLVNIMGKPPQQLFEEFSGKTLTENMSGDVKYHMGFSSDITTPGGSVHLALAFNPSHLEIINPVVEGSVRARQERRQHKQSDAVLPVLIHGDAAFAGQGVVMETFNMSQTTGFGTGGTIHFIINNQVGFTTSRASDARSTLYASDVAKIIQAPVFHVNGDDPEAVIFVTQLALAFRMEFHRDVVIDLVCYRRHGHNEADEPSGTQPLMYARINTHPTPFQRYSQQLVAEGIIDKPAAAALEEDYRSLLDSGECTVAETRRAEPNPFSADWTPYLGQEWRAEVATILDKKNLVDLAKRLTSLPPDLVLQKQVGMEMQSRAKMAEGTMPINWGFAETLAYATLLKEGYHIRLVGQDSGRGTFSHRHAKLHDMHTDEVYIPLQHLSDTAAHFTVIDSLLSEEAVLGFEYGYACTDPKTLVLWEAQFGDFFNGAQVVIDQFISSGFQKWGRLCGLTLLLPHGFEGAGPEHSSARLERFLQLCAEHNMQVCVPSTPAQMFHLLRRQMCRPYRVPLIVMTPKSLLRHKLVVSTLEDLGQGQFELVIPEIDSIDSASVKRVVLCSGKVYYHLLEKRRESNRDDVAIIRIEQLYPFPEPELLNCLGQYPHAKEIVWCQEEPQNQGAWYSMHHRLSACVGPEQFLIYAGRDSSASPAAGYYTLHHQQQDKLIADALGG
jgi:2-oxoglutarate dehydrogenase E1 component